MTALAAWIPMEIYTADFIFATIIIVVEFQIENLVKEMDGDDK